MCRQQRAGAGWTGSSCRRKRSTVAVSVALSISAIVEETVEVHLALVLDRPKRP